MTERFLRDNYGSGGSKGRRRCQRGVRRAIRSGQAAGLKRLHIVKVRSGRARVRVLDTKGHRAVLILVDRPRGWLLLEVQR